MIHNDEKFEKMLAELLEEIGGYPNTLLKGDAELENPPGKSFNQTEKALYSIKQSLDDMRICIKYLLFDLDATRRENLYFKKLLDDKEM